MPESLSQRLISYLRQATADIKEGDLLRIPSAILDGFLRSSTSADEDELSSIVALIDGNPNRGNCARFDLLSFQCMLVILLRAPPCLARERGAFLFLESMRELSYKLKCAVDVEFVTAARRRKCLIGQGTCRLFLQTLVAADSSLPRQWSAQFLYELVRDCEENQRRIALITGLTWKIGRVVAGDSDYILKLITAHILRLLALAEFDLSAFWPANIDGGWLTHFSSNPQLPYRDWVRSFSQYLYHSGSSIPDTTIFILASVYATGFDMDLESCVSALMVRDRITLLSMDEVRFQVLDVGAESFTSVQQLHDDPLELQVIPCPEGICTVDGATMKLERFIIGAYDSSQASKMISAISNLKGTVPRDLNNNSTRYGVSAFVTAWSDEYPTPNETGLVVGGCQRVETAPVKFHRELSSAIIELPTVDEVLFESRRFLEQKRMVLSTQTDAENSTTQLQVEEIVELNIEDSRDSRALSIREKSPLEARDEERRVEMVEGSELSMDEVQPSALSHIVMTPIDELETSTEARDVAGEPHMDRAGDNQRGLPDLAKEALQLHAPNVDIPTTSPNDVPQPAGTDGDTHVTDTAGDVDKCVTNVPDSQFSIAPQADSARNMGLNAPANVADDTTTTAATDETAHPNQITTESAKPASTTTNSRLKRPLHKVAGLSAALDNVDWDQDLRVVDGHRLTNSPTNPTTAKKQKRISDNKEAPVPAKAKKQLSSAVKRAPLKPLPVTPVLESTDIKQRKRRQVTKTLTSSRQRRTAATKASKRMSIAAEQENAAYDVDDPIETDSSAVAPQITESVGDRAVLDPQHALAIGTPSLNFSPTAAAVGEVGNDTASREQSVCPEVSSPQNPSSKGQPLTVGVSDGDRAMADDNGNGMANKSIQKGEVQGKAQTLAKRLALTLADAGISQEKEGTRSSPKPTMDLVKTDKMSQVSKNVSNFISRQVAVSKRVSSPDKESTPCLPSTSTNDQDRPSSVIDVENDVDIISNPSSPFKITQPKFARKCRATEDEGRKDQTAKQTRTVKFQVSDGPQTGTGSEAANETGESSGTESNLSAFEPKEDMNPTYSRTMGSLSLTGDEDDSTAAQSVSIESETNTDDELPLHQPVSISSSELDSNDCFEEMPPGARMICQSQTVDENGSPKPKTSTARDALVGLRGHQAQPLHTGQKGFAASRPPNKETRIPTGLDSRENLTNAEVSIFNIFQNNKRREREEHPISAARSAGNTVFPSHGKQQATSSSVVHHPFRQTMGKEKQKARQPTFAERLRASSKWPYPRKAGRQRRNLGKNPVYSNKNYQKERDEFGDQSSEGITSDGDTLIQEDTQASSSTPDSAMRRGQSSRSGWQDFMNASDQADIDIMLKTTKRLMVKLAREERHMFKVVDTYQNGGDRIIDQLEKLHSQQLDRYAEDLRPIKEKLVELCNETSKQLDTGDRSLQTSQSLKDLSSNLAKGRKKLLGKLDAMNAKYDNELSEIQGQ